MSHVVRRSHPLIASLTSMGSMTSTVHQLNMSWTVAAAKARRYSSRLPTYEEGVIASC